MTEHWQWAMDAAMREYAFSHFLFLTDRMMFKTGALRDLFLIAQRFPDQIISYSHDRIVDDATPVVVEQNPGTGQVLQVETDRLIHLYSHAVIHLSLPRMLNCVVPRSILRTIQERYGGIFSSLSPDFSFCCRALDAVSSILFYNSSPIFHYALARSNGASASRGDMSPDRADFFANVSVQSIEAAKKRFVTSLATVGSSIFYEYSVFARQTRSSRFEPLDENSCLRYIACEVENIENHEVRRELRSLLAAAGWQPPPPSTIGISWAVNFTRKLMSPTKVARRLRRSLLGPHLKPLWLLVGRQLRMPLPSDCRFEFSTIEEAMAYMNEFPGGRTRSLAPYDEQLQGRVVWG
jgi:hypothetical protein